MTGLVDAEISHATFVRASPERVYDAIATAEGLDGWFTMGARVDARPGGEIWFRWQDWGPDRVTDEDGGPVLADPFWRRCLGWAYYNGLLPLFSMSGANLSGANLSGAKWNEYTAWPIGFSPVA